MTAQLGGRCSRWRKKAILSQRDVFLFIIVWVFMREPNQIIRTASSQHEA